MNGMNALASSKATVYRKRICAQPRSVWLSLLLMGCVGASALAQGTKEAEETPSVAPPAQEAMQAVWKAKEVTFSYRSSKSIYTCSGLETRVKTIFLALGARDDLEVRASSCNENEMVLDQEFENPLGRGDSARDPSARTWGRGGDLRHEGGWEDPYDRLQNQGGAREQNAFVRARLLMPVELTREVGEEIKRDKSRRELISRVTGDPAAKQNDPVWFPAQWQSVTLSRESIGLEPEECELLDQMSTGVFKELGVRVVGKSRRCSGFSSSRIPPSLTVEALLMAPVGPTGLPEIKLEGEGEPAAPEHSDKSSDQGSEKPDQ